MFHVPTRPSTPPIVAIFVFVAGRELSFIKNMNENPSPVDLRRAVPRIVAPVVENTGAVLAPARVESAAGVSVPMVNTAGLTPAVVLPNPLASLPSSSGQWPVGVYVGSCLVRGDF